jgi:hypothetical protein
METPENKSPDEIQDQDASNIEQHPLLVTLDLSAELIDMEIEEMERELGIKQDSI